MTRNKHLVAGMIIGPVINYALKWLVSSDLSVGFVISLLIGALGSILPDKIEKPTSIWHRKFWHSRVLLGIIIISIPIIIFVHFLRGPIKGGLIILLGSYALHLWMDSRTEAGLPIFNRYVK